MTKVSKRKWVFAGLMALTSVMADIGTQLVGDNVNITQTLIVGLIIGGAARILGAILAAMTIDEVDGE